jgi:hypothetical protein
MPPALFAVYFGLVRNEPGFLGYVLFGILAYGFLAGLVNRSVIRLDAKRLAARHRPLPLQVGARADTDRVESFFVEARRKRGAYAYRTYYYVVARLKGSARVDVLKHQTLLERAVAVQRALADGLARIRKGEECA